MKITTYIQKSIEIDGLPKHNNKVIALYSDGGCDYLTAEEMQEHIDKDKYFGGGRLRKIYYWLEKAPVVEQEIKTEEEFLSPYIQKTEPSFGEGFSYVNPNDAIWAMKEYASQSQPASLKNKSAKDIWENLLSDEQRKEIISAIEDTPSLNHKTTLSEQGTRKLLEEASYLLSTAVSIFNGSTGLEHNGEDRYMKFVNLADKIQAVLDCSTLESVQSFTKKKVNWISISKPPEDDKEYICCGEDWAGYPMFTAKYDPEKKEWYTMNGNKRMRQFPTHYSFKNQV